MLPMSTARHAMLNAKCKWPLPELLERLPESIHVFSFAVLCNKHCCPLGLRPHPQQDNCFRDNAMHKVNDIFRGPCLCKERVLIQCIIAGAVGVLRVHS